MLLNKLNILKSAPQICRYFSIGTTSAVTTKCKQKICIVGAGPAGFYVAQYLLKHLPNSEIDLLEKLPVPFGLVRFGVAPDHPEVKNVINTFTKTAENERLRYFGNLSLGQDYSLRDLRERYHAVVLSYGAAEDRKLNIPNENERNVLSARDFVAWYNGLPGMEHFCPDLGKETVSIVGQGNVAIDVSRILLTPIDILKKTDITAEALQVISDSQVRKVHLIGRRGPLQAAFTIKELREMTKLPNCNIVWRPQDFEGVKEAIANLARPRKRLTELMLKSLAEPIRPGNKEFSPIFLRSPKHIDTNSLLLTVNQLNGDRAVATNLTESVETNLILRSIGYKSICLDKDVNFNEKSGFVNNIDGRVLRADQHSDGKSTDNGLYVSGWLATGPTGVILTTMNNSFAVAHAICEDFNGGTIDSSEMKCGIDDLVAAKAIVTWDGWKRIDKAEIEAGDGKPREKIVDVQKMLEIAI